MQSGTKTKAPYGSWRSPITAELAAVPAAPFSGLVLEGRDVYWLETRPTEAGRTTIMRRSSSGMVTEITPPECYVRSTVHEYGGGAFTVSRGTVYFSNYWDQHLYSQVADTAPRLLTTAQGHRYADLIVDHRRRRLICVREDHSGSGEPENSLVAVDLSGEGTEQVLVCGNDFYSNPRLSPDGTQLAYLTWNHPNMPWDGCELRVLRFHPDGTPGSGRLIAGGSAESIFQPEWSPGGVLHFVAEPGGWWNLYRWNNERIEPLHPMDAEFGRPMWVFGHSSYGFADPGRILCAYTTRGMDRLAWLETATRELTEIDSPYTEVDYLRCGDGMAAFIGGSPRHPYGVIQMDFTDNATRPINGDFEVPVSDAYISIPESIRFPSTGGIEAHAFYYRPKNPEFTAPGGELPPLLVISHGGPTSSASTALRFPIQYWTSRGFAVADVNYGGSIGYGREYRRRLNGQWGVVDVDDCCNAALFLAAKGLADRGRLAIKGGSAGGYTTFACLTFRNEVFSVGSAHYGVADLETFANDTHKFESHYAETLVGPYPGRKDIYVSRSPIHFATRLRSPLILFQGDEDKIVPPVQSQMMFEAVRQRGLPSAYLLFRGEQHGFRRADSLRRAQEAELYFFSRIFGFDLPESVEMITIENLPSGS